MQETFTRQSELVGEIERICINFLKDGKERKTKEYIEKRLVSLDNLWKEFESNNQRLTDYEDKNHEYFARGVYAKMKEYYQGQRQVIASYPVPSSSTKHTPEEKGTNFNIPVSPKVDRGTVPSSPVDELLAKQRTNFRAFSRILKRINVDTIEERWEIEDQLKDLQYRWRTIDEQHLDIDNYLQGEDGLYEAQFMEYEEEYEKIKRQLNRKLNSSTHLQQSTPKVEIPCFTGKYSQWPTFFDLFRETIHNNTALSKAQKMQHLKGKIKGEAERLIQHLNISSDNYETAWDILIHRYNNPQALFTNQIEIFLNQPNIQKQTSYELKRLYDTTMECIHAIHNFGVDTSSWDPLLVHLIAKKLDVDTLTDYKEARRSPRDLPSFDELMSFLEGKFTALEPINKKERDMSQNKQTPFHPTRGSYAKPNYQDRYQKRTYQAVPTFTPKCPLCNAEHDLYKCKRFLNLSPESKIKTLTKYNICQNCLYKHFDKPCISTRRCKYCNGEHNTIIHPDIVILQSSATKNYLPMSRPSTSTMTHDNNVPKTPNEKQHNVNHVAAQDEEILLTTLLIKVKSNDNTYITLRALLDQGSQISLISESTAQLLGLQRQKYHASVSGIGVSAKQSKGMVNLECESIYGDYNFTTQALVISRVINNLPNASFNKRVWPHLQNINLADPEYNISKPIDLLLDASVYSDIIMNGLIKGSPQAPIAQQTKLGWILSGSVRTFNCAVIINQVDEISKFWEVEEVTQPHPNLTEQEQRCEDFYMSTTKRLKDGRYEVALPMKPGYEQQLGTSRGKAVMQFIQLEKRKNKNKLLLKAYQEFMREYEAMSHMRPAVTNTSHPTCYLPHHGVLKLDSSTTALRVVFNASAKTSTGRSLNDLMECGPNLQQDLQGLILKWRTHKYVITADIEKMFRQFRIRESDQHLQTIIWRDSPQELLREYQLTTVTYGTKAAPYLAMRTLRQIARDNAAEYPLAAVAIENCFYTDDLLAGQESIELTKEIQLQLITVLRSAGLNLRKWSSNEPTLIKDLSAKQLDTPFEFKDTESRKTLGLRWNPSSDTFTFQNKIDYHESQGRHTKRQLLSDISKIYDPLGWLSPVTIKAKILFQKTWLLELKWDDELPTDILKEWQVLREDLKNIENFKIDRYLGPKQSYQIHAFCDASEKAYACAVYVITCNKGEYTSRLIAAKTKVAPQCKSLSLPRLELMGALLLSQLVKKISASIEVDGIPINAWTDSMVVLGWLKGDITRWKQFVANRVQEITNIISPTNWRHVRSEENPADYATRGLMTTNLQEKLWWEGPKWLTSFDSKNIKPIEVIEPSIETKRSSVNTALYQDDNFNIINDLLQRYSSLTSIIHIVGWVIRFMTQSRNVSKQHAMTKNLSSAELEIALNTIIKNVQLLEFRDEIYQLTKNNQVKSTSKLANLNPFLDKFGILRVGGRLLNANLSYNAKHPAIVPSHHRLTELIIYQAHILTLHGGPKLTLSYLRERYWVISGMRAVKKQIRLCVKCRRYNQETRPQIMADLPSPRVTPSRPFSNTGVDFTGHIEIKSNKGRGIKTTKGYVAVFVCLATKAVHLELVSDLSTAAFLAAFRRMCSRRGTPRHVYSDNGTNFVGASRLLKQEYRAILDCMDDSFIKEINDIGITWHFNAPSWPNAAGLWESCVKSMKFHLKRVLGEQRLTYEEFITLLYQIEACLNSRPLCTLTENIEDDVLTPGHFLIGDSLISRPQCEPNNIDLPTRWRLIQNINKCFWKMWSSEYLQQLQTRSKWLTPRKNIEIDDLVIIKEDNLPPGKWAMGRVQEVHPGKDGYVRVVSLKTRNKIIKRPVNKLITLPVNDVIKTSAPKQPPVTPPQTTCIEPQRRHRGQGLFSTFITMLLMLAVLITPSLQQGPLPVNTTALSKYQGLYFDKVSDLQLIKDEWKLVVYYNMTSYWQGLSDIQHYVNHLKAFSHEKSPQYQSIILQLVHELNQIEHYNSILSLNSNKRQKRGLINGVGYVANSLFGVLDERFAEQYRIDIEKIKGNENHLQNMIKNQTSIIEAEYNIIRRNENVMNKQLSLIKTNLHTLSAVTKKVVLDQQDYVFITTSALTANMILSNFRRIQDVLINTIIDVSHGRIDAHLLPPEQLEEQMNIIQGQLRDLSLPTDHSNIRQLYKLLKVFARLHKNYLIIEVKIPLINNEIFELDQIITVPLRNNDQTDYTLTVFPYIAFHIKRDLALLLSHNDVQSCLHSQTDRLLCSVDKPIYDLKIKQSLCNIKVISSDSIDSSPCTRKQSPSCGADKWIKLHRHNSWLYSCCDKCSIRIFCPPDMELRTLVGNGIITIGQGCSIKGERFTLYAHNNFFNRMQQRLDNIEVPKLSILNTILNTSLPQDDQPLDETPQKTWEDIKTQIEDLKSQSSVQLNEHDVHHYVVQYIALGGLVVLTGVVVFLWRRRRASRHADYPAPAPAPAAPTRAPAAPAPAPLPRSRTASLTNVNIGTSPVAKQRIFNIPIPSAM